MAKGSTETTTQTIDPQAERFRNYVYDVARAVPETWSPYGGQTVAGPSEQTLAGFQRAGQIDPRISGAYGGFVNNLGLAQQTQANLLGQGGQFTGADMQSYMNPYQQQVISGIQSDYDRMRQQSLNQVGAGATAAGAFGGARHGLAEAARMGEIGREEGRTLGQFRHGGFESAAQKWAADRQFQAGQAQQMANLGLTGAAGLGALQQQQARSMMGAGEYGRGIEQQRLSDAYQQWQQQQAYPMARLAALTGTSGQTPYGQTSEKFTPFDPWGTLIGGITAVSGLPLGGGG